LALDGDLAAVEVDYPFDDGKTDAVALARVRFVGLVELVEDLVELFGLNVLARVRDRDSNALARLADIERDIADGRIIVPGA